jgi:NAD(P)-dependent dehydrogenase (short-subunit alcohol dehydrogenase family)
LRAYVAYSKLANILWTKELQKRIDAEGSPIIAISLHPGNPNTSPDQLPSSWRTIGSFIMKLFSRPAHERGYTSAIAAAHPEVRKKADAYKGAYLEPVGKLATPSKVARNPERSKELWETTETFLKSIGLTSDA